jgi:hypothetical protein
LQFELLAVCRVFARTETGQKITARTTILVRTSTKFAFLIRMRISWLGGGGNVMHFSARRRRRKCKNLQQT